MHALEPEVAGQLGPRTELDRRTHPPAVSRLHYVFDGWLGDELLETFPCFIVTERLAVKLCSVGLTGFELRELEVSTSEQFAELHPDVDLPGFQWLVVRGQLGRDDFAIAHDHRLVVSDRALAIVRPACPHGLTATRVEQP